MANKTPYNKDELKQFRSLIHKKREKRLVEFNSLKNSLKDQKSYMANLHSDFKHDASEIRNREMLKRMKTRAKKGLNKYDDALQRIKNGTYGICRKTGQVINKNRLISLPEATTCISSK